MAELYYRLNKNVKSMTAQELRAIFNNGDVDNSYLMRSIIMSEKNFPSVNYERSLRSLWYSIVKPTLDKLGKLSKEDQTEEGLTKWDATLSRYVADLLRRGELTYKQLHILDNSRQRANPRTQYMNVNSQVFGYKVNIAPYSNIIIATEKDTVYNIISAIAELFGCSCISCKGQNSLGAMEDLVRKIVSAQYSSLEAIYILTMTDYDPAGYYIAEALETQVCDILYALGRSNVGVTITRVGITPDQLDDEMVEANKYSPKPANLEKWLDRTDGINGEPYGLELDALEPVEIRRIFVDHLIDLVDSSVYQGFIKEAYIRRLVLETMQPKVDRIAKRIIVHYEDQLQLEDFDIKELAVDGMDYIPSQNYVKDTHKNRIQRAVLEYFDLGDLGGEEDYEILNDSDDEDEYPDTFESEED